MQDPVDADGEFSAAGVQSKSVQGCGQPLEGMIEKVFLKEVDNDRWSFAQGRQDDGIAATLRIGGGHAAAEERPDRIDGAFPLCGEEQTGLPEHDAFVVAQADHAPEELGRLLPQLHKLTVRQAQG